MRWAIGNGWVGILDVARVSHSRLQPGSGSLPFDCAQQKGAHTLTYIFMLNATLLLCCVSLPLGLGGVVERRKVPSKKDLGKKKGAHVTFFLLWKWHFHWQTLAIPRCLPGQGGVPAAPRFPSGRLAGCGHMYPTGSLSLHLFLSSQTYLFKIHANTYTIIIKLFTIWRLQ